MTKKTKTKAQKKAEEDANLDQALAETFPASDPPSMTQPRTGADAPQGFVTLAGFTCFYCLPGECLARRFQCLSLASP
jgi:hypothetical protein